MDTDRLNRWLTLAANFAVLLSIIFLAVEIRQNTEMTRAQITQSRADTAINLADSFYNSEFLPDILVKTRSNEALSPAEGARFRFWLRATLRNLDNNFQQAGRGLLGEHIPRATASAIENAILSNNAAALEYCSESKEIFSDEFAAFVDEVLQASDKRN